MLFAANSLRFADGEGALVDYSTRNRIIRSRDVSFFQGLSCAGLLHEANSARPKVGNELGYNPWLFFRRSVQSAKRIDVLSPEVVQKLDVLRLGHCPTQGHNECGRRIMA